jgi:hypothetical protein
LSYAPWFAVIAGLKTYCKKEPARTAEQPKKIQPKIVSASPSVPVTEKKDETRVPQAKEEHAFVIRPPVLPPAKAETKEEVYDSSFYPALPEEPPVLIEAKAPGSAPRCLSYDHFQ